ncbi:MAG: LysM peptidoglycan-binding domain-containing protein [Anaerolineaceae bacterium]|nr:LysM peptidoglycan-binding domain-containing protein [Anaerolineaceae bacterium]
MRLRTFTITLAIALLALTLAACQRSASQAPTDVSAPTSSELDFQVGTEPVQAMVDDAVKATETAFAMLTTPLPEQAGGGAPAATVEPPVPTAVPFIATPQLSLPATYALQNGEWPICIARRYNLDIGALFQANGLNMNSKPAAGAVLTLPQSGSWSSAYGARALKPHPASYTVQAGDSIYTIACAFGDVSPEAIIAVNQLSGPGDISAGKTLQIP